MNDDWFTEEEWDDFFNKMEPQSTKTISVDEFIEIYGCCLTEKEVKRLKEYTDKK